MTQQEEVVITSRPVGQEGHCFLVVEHYNYKPIETLTLDVKLDQQKNLNSETTHLCLGLVRVEA